MKRRALIEVTCFGERIRLRMKQQDNWTSSPLPLVHSLMYCAGMIEQHNDPTQICIAELTLTRLHAIELLQRWSKLVDTAYELYRQEKSAQRGSYWLSYTRQASAKDALLEGIIKANLVQTS